MNKFNELGVDSDIAKLLEKQGINEPTSIQAQSIPHILKGADVVGESATGSGKTIAFGVGAIQNCEQGLSTLIIAPTREIALQITEVLKSISKTQRKKIVPIYGGVSINPQIDHLRSAQIVVGTPGRILDHVSRRTIDFSQLQMLIIDEADKLFDMGFIDDIKRIIQQTPDTRQTVLFSATFPPQTKGLVKTYMKNPIQVKGVAQVDPKKLTQKYFNVAQNLKFSLLIQQIETSNDTVIVFSNTKRMTDVIAKSLRHNGIKSEAIHGDMSQAKRNAALDAFKKSKCQVLVCTDVAARGLDIPHVGLVVNYDLPKDSKDYVHRAGRTARAGKAGEVINLVARNDYDSFSKILRDYHEFNIVEAESPYIEKKEMVQPQRREGRGGFNRRGPAQVGKFNRNARKSDGSRDSFRQSDRASREGGRNNSRGSSQSGFSSGGSREGGSRDDSRRGNFRPRGRSGSSPRNGRGRSSGARRSYHEGR